MNIGELAACIDAGNGARHGVMLDVQVAGAGTAQSHLDNRIPGI